MGTNLPILGTNMAKNLGSPPSGQWTKENIFLRCLPLLALLFLKLGNQLVHRWSIFLDIILAAAGFSLNLMQRLWVWVAELRFEWSQAELARQPVARSCPSSSCDRWLAPPPCSATGPPIGRLNDVSPPRPITSCLSWLRFSCLFLCLHSNFDKS